MTKLSKHGDGQSLAGKGGLQVCGAELSRVCIRAAGSFHLR